MGANAGGFTCPMAASGCTTAAGWMKLPDASRAAAWESPAGHSGVENEKLSDLTRAAEAVEADEIRRDR